MPRVRNAHPLAEKLRLLREAELSDAWIASVIASTDDLPPAVGIDQQIWATYIFVVAYRHGHLKRELDPKFSQEITDALDWTVSYLDEKHPGLLDAPSAVAFSGPAFEDSQSESDESHVAPAQETPSLEEAEDDEFADPSDVAWYGVSRVAAGTMLLMGRDGEAMPALQLRLYNALDQEIFNRMLPFGDTLFIVSTLLENLNNAFDLHQKSLKSGGLSPRMRTSMEGLIESADVQLQQLRETLRAAG